MPTVTPSQFAGSAEIGAVTPSQKTMENRAARYRNIAAEVRARADNVLEERDRRGMLMAAEVWDRLAALDERSAAPFASQHSATQHSN
jgi:hypothetical protein